MSSRQTDDPLQESEDEGTTSSLSSSDNEEESEASIEEQIRALTTEILISNNGDLRAINWDFVAQIASPTLGFAMTAAECEERFSRIVDRVYPPNQPVTNAQASAGNNQSSTSTNAVPEVANGGQAAQLPVYGQLPSQSTSNGSGHATSAADPLAAASSVPNPHTDTEGEDESDADLEEST